MNIPELPRELPELTLSAPMLINATTQTKRAKQKGFNAGIKHQFLRSQMEYMAFMLQYQLALKRIAELEATIISCRERLLVLEKADAVTGGALGLRIEYLEKRNAELEAENTYLLGTSVDNGDYMLLNERAEKAEAQVASLKEQLAVFTKVKKCSCEPGEPVVVPPGKYCGNCGWRENDLCDEPADAMAWLYKDMTGEYLKAPGCPVPAIEENKNEPRQ
jgi:hypothetical protein